MLNMSLTSGARKVTLLALWDGKPTGDGKRGGTAHMVELAEQAGTVDVKVIDSSQL